MRRRVGLTRDRAPGLEPLLAGAERPDAGLHAIGDHERRIGGEERRNLRLIRLQLLEGAPDGRALVGRVLELDYRQRQPVHEDHNIRSARVLPVGDRELVHGEPVIVGGRLEVDRQRLGTGDRTICAPVLDVDAVDEHAMDGSIALDERGRVDSCELAIGVFDGVGAEAGVQAGEGRSQTAFEYHVAKAGVAAFGCGFTDFHGWAVENGVAQFVEPFEGGFFDDGFGE